MTNWGPTGKLVYERTYSRTKPDGTKETWPETVRRVVDGNLALGGGRHLLPHERENLIRMMEEFKILPAGRHLWASGVKGRQYLFNCHVAGWDRENIPEHFEFTFLRLMEGGGVGSNYSNEHLLQSPVILGTGRGRLSPFRVHIVCDPMHPDYRAMKDAGLLSEDYTSDWGGTYEVEDSREGWAAALVDLIQVYYRTTRNQNRVYDVSRVRPEGWRLKTFGGRASGPLPLAVMLHKVAATMNRNIGRGLDGLSAMEIDHAIAECVVSGGNRRSARMAIMRWDDPQIHEFIRCKSDPEMHWTTNISVEVDKEFFSAVANNDENANKVLKAIAEGMLLNGEPGIWNSDNSNEGEPNRVIATNPCGEIALEPWENCNLGHVNLAAFVDDKGNFDLSEMEHAHELMTRFLLRATYGDVNDPKQREVLARNRRIGVGHLGVASFLALTGQNYDQLSTNSVFCCLLEHLREGVREFARKYAHDLRIPVPVKMTTVAPTGSIAKMPGVSEGIHPIFSRYFIRRIRLSTVDPDQRRMIQEYADKGYTIEDCLYAPNTVVIKIPTKDSLVEAVEAIHGADKAEELVKSPADMTLESMLHVQRIYQTHWADNAVSFTANIDPEKYKATDLAEIIREFGPVLKGMTVFPEESRPQAPYERITKEEYERLSGREVSDAIDEECANGACPIR